MMMMMVYDDDDIFLGNQQNRNLKQGSKAVSNWTGSNMDPDAVQRHYNR